MNQDVEFFYYTWGIHPYVDVDWAGLIHPNAKLSDTNSGKHECQDFLRLSVVDVQPLLRNDQATLSLEIRAGKRPNLYPINHP